VNGYLTVTFPSFGISNAASNVGFRTDGWYIRDDWQITKTDRVTLGFRKQYYTGNESVGASPWNSSAYATANELQYSRILGSHSTGYIRISENFRLPNVDDNSSVNYLSVPPYSPIYLVPQTSHDIDLGLSTKIANWSSEFKYFRSDIRNEIGFDPNVYGNINFDPTKREGLELKEYLKLAEQWDAKLNLQVIRATFTSGQYSGNTIPSTSKVNGNLTLDYLITSKQQIGLTERFSSERYASGDYYNNQAKIPGYLVTDLTYGYREKSWSIVGSINNVLDKNYADIDIYKSFYSPPYNLTTYPNPGRNFSLLGRYSF
jgi:iron complex outermembrane receptor protein